MKASILIVFIVLFLSSPTSHSGDQRDLVSEWNQAVLEVAEAEDGFLTLKGVRTAAMLHIAMHDALNVVYGRYQPYVYDKSIPDADPLTAAVQAAFVVAVSQYPDREEHFETLRRRALDAVPDSAAKTAGIRSGSAAAAAILEKRADDGWNNSAEYQWHPMAPGVYAEFNEHSGTPAGFVFGSGWATARPFALRTGYQFRSPPPPDIQSPTYAAAFKEVKEAGRRISKTRTEDQSHLALWWKDFAENSHNRLARQLVSKSKLDIADSARLFALINIGIFDAYVNVFDNKFFYNHWRPYTAIRWASNDGNDETLEDPEWTNLHDHTYAFPSYPSAHGTACTAAMTAIADTFGDDFSFTMQTSAVDIAGPFSGKMEMRPPTRSYEKFSDAAMECSLSRVYLGIHFRYDSTEGYALGKRIGNHVTGSFLQRR